MNNALKTQKQIKYFSFNIITKNTVLLPNKILHKFMYIGYINLTNINMMEIGLSSLTNLLKSIT